MKRDRVIKSTAVILAVIFLVLIAAMAYQYVSCFLTAQDVPDYPPFPAARIVVYGSSADTVSAHIALRDTEGNIFAELERSWRGASLALELAGFSYAGKSVFVPYRVSASGAGGIAGIRPAGTDLKKYFMKRGKCLFFPEASREAGKALYAFARLALNGAANRVPLVEVSALSLGVCESGEYYSVFIDSKGSAFLVKE